MVPKTQNGQTVLVKIGRPLTAASQDELRKKMQNRVSAIEARMRKKRKMEQLEKRVAELTEENESLRIENARLQCKGKNTENSKREPKVLTLRRPTCQSCENFEEI